MRTIMTGLGCALFFAAIVYGEPLAVLALVAICMALSIP